MSNGTKRQKAGEMGTRSNKDWNQMLEYHAGDIDTYFEWRKISLWEFVLIKTLKLFGFKKNTLLRLDSKN